MNIRAEIRNAEREAERSRRLRYLQIYRTVRKLDPDPRHDSYWRVNGQVCDTLDETVAAIMEN